MQWYYCRAVLRMSDLTISDSIATTTTTTTIASFLQNCLFSHLFMKLLYEDIEDAYYRARRWKLKKPDIIAREENLEHNMKQLYAELCDETYMISPTKRFIISDPVVREVIVLDFRDRIVQHLIHHYLYPLRDKRFFYDVYSNRRGKGTLFGIQRLSKWIRWISDNFRQEAHVLKLDIQSFFLSVDRQTLRDLIIQDMRILDPVRDKIWVLDLVKQFIFHDYVTWCDDKTSYREKSLLPHHKSLFSAPVGQGMPLGNLTSQLFANIYLHQFDLFVKHDLKIKYYGRYVDDFYLIHPSSDYLISCLSQIRDFLYHRLHLTLHPHKIYLQSIHKGVKFLWVMVYPYHRTLAQRTIGRVFVKLSSCDYGPLRPIGHLPCEGRKTLLRRSMMSYRGLAIHHDCYRLRKIWYAKYLTL